MSTSDSSPRITFPSNPLTPDDLSTISVAEAIENNAAIARLIGDLFGSNAEDYTVLASDRSRYGAWLLLSSVSQALDSIDEIVGQAHWPDDRPSVDTR